GRALRKRRGNPEDLPPTTLPRVIRPSCHSERSEESSSSTGPGFYTTYSTPLCHSERSEESLKRSTAYRSRDSSLRQNDTFWVGSGGPGRTMFYIPRRFAPPPSKGDNDGAPGSSTGPKRRGEGCSPV